MCTDNQSRDGNTESPFLFHEEVDWVTVKDVYQCTVRGGRLGDEVTSQTQAIQSIANKIKTPNRVSKPKKG